MAPQAQSVLNAAQIAKLIPHHGSMCLLESVRHYDAQSIRCAASSHRLPTNPLREQGVLHAVCGIRAKATKHRVVGAWPACARCSSVRVGLTM
jgi:predicted hotdog family 3-hydroxylacyl-ACP dehydratase